MLHVAVDVGVELAAGEDAVETGSLGSGQMLLVYVRAERDELDWGESLLKRLSGGGDLGK